MLRTSREVEREAATEAAELLAARLEVERLRAALEGALGFQCCWQFVHGGPHSEACPRRLLSAPPPGLGPLRELVAAWRAARLDSVIMPARLAAALDDLLAAYPCLGEGRWLPQL